MEGGGNSSSSSSSYMMGFGDNSSGGLSSLMMMNNSGAGTRRNFLLHDLPFTNNSTHDSQRVSTLMLREFDTHHNNTITHFMEANSNHHHNITSDHRNSSGNTGSGSGSDYSNSMRAKIMSHPLFPRLLASYANCQKVGAPAEVVARLEEACGSGAAMVSSSTGTGCIGEDPALDQFMEAYCEMLTKYEQELTKPFKEAMLFLSRIECQFKALTVVAPNSGRNVSSEEEVNANDNFLDPQSEDRELKGQLLRRYSGYLGSLKQEFLKKKKKGKLPKEARQQLLDWWSKHYKWPYPSESQKLALAQSTGLDQKQINNWFINQRKRHWKPSDDMQFVVMDAAYPHYYLENVMGNTFPMDCTPSHL